MSHRAPLPVLAPPEADRLLDCVHCGICLSVCPTYELLGTEGDSPRGRLYLMRALAEGRTELNSRLVAHLDACLGCRACETACPSGVPYAELLTPVRGAIERSFRRPWRERLARRLLVGLLGRPAALAPLLAVARGARRVFGPGGGPVGLVQRLLFGPKAPPLPEAASLRVKPLPPVTPPRGARRARVALLAGCVMQVLYQHVNRATIDALAANGCEVLVPRAAGCCGAFALHNGYLDAARRHARALIRALEAERFDALIVNSAGCGSSVREYPQLFHSDPTWEPRARALAAKTRDVCEFLAELGVVAPTREVRRRIAYHDACHLAHGQGVRSQPRALLRALPGAEVVEIRDSDTCCGSAGIYNFLQPELAVRLQERKVDAILAAAPDVVALGNPGCHAWIEAGLRARGSDLPVRHTVELLAEAWGAAEKPERSAS